MSVSNSLDPNFQDTLHLILREGEDAERRHQTRRPFRCVQLLAPYDGEQMPAAEDFSHVQCYDISAGGFSYYLPEAPNYDYLILALGRAPFTFVIARAVHFETVETERGKQYLVGCRFLRKI